MTKINIGLEIEQVDAIVIDELMRHYDTLNDEAERWLKEEAEGTLPPHKIEDLRYNTRTMNSIAGVLEFYMSDKDFAAWLDSYDAPDRGDESLLPDVGAINVEEIIEHEDGSATYSINMSQDALIALAKRGVMEAIVDAVKLGEKGCQYDKDDVKDRHDD